MSLALWLNKSKTRSQTEDDEVIKELQSNESSAVCDQRNETQASSSSVRSTSHPASSKSNESSAVCDKQASSSSVTSHPKSKNRKRKKKMTSTDGGPQPKQPNNMNFLLFVFYQKVFFNSKSVSKAHN